MNNKLQAFTSLGRNEPTLVNDPVVVELVEKHSVPVSLILLAYALVQGIGIIPKSVTPSRIHENLGVVNVKLTNEEVAKLTALDRNQSYTLCAGWKVS
jgi:diketogulonate reductase-like aldo/keto reductase